MFCKEGRIQTLDKLDAVGGYFVGLFLAPTTVDVDTEWAEVTEASFPGYSAASVAFTAASLDGSGNAYMDLSGPVTFTQSSPATAEVVYGAFLIDTYGGGNKLMDIKLFPSPLSFSTTGNSVTINNWKFTDGPLAP